MRSGGVRSGEVMVGKHVSGGMMSGDNEQSIAQSTDYQQCNTTEEHNT